MEHTTNKANHEIYKETDRTLANGKDADSIGLLKTDKQTNHVKQTQTLRTRKKQILTNNQVVKESNNEQATPEQTQTKQSKQKKRQTHKE